MLRDLSGAKKILIDSNLLIVLIVGAGYGTLLGQKKTKGYDHRDFEILREEIQSFDGLVSTPYILSELNGHVNITSPKNDDRLRETFRDECKKWIIIDGDYRILLSHKYFTKFGLTDVSIVEAASPDTVVLSSDGDLINVLKEKDLVGWKYQDLKDMYDNSR